MTGADPAAAGEARETWADEVGGAWVDVTAELRAAGEDYRAFWTNVGRDFPSLKGAASTDYYVEGVRRLFERYFPPLAGRSLLKTDLWDEAKGTEVLIALRNDSVDLVYSMGTIEHFPEYATALAEIYRVLKPGGRAIIGVPNTLDPFLRPLMVRALQAFDAYAFGSEKSFTPRELRRVLESAGFRCMDLSGVLFIPGPLRMLDLALYTRGSRLERATRALVRPFAWLSRRFLRLNRHGYLIAWVVEKPRGGPRPSPVGLPLGVRSRRRRHRPDGGGCGADGGRRRRRAAAHRRRAERAARQSRPRRHAPRRRSHAASSRRRTR